MKLKPFLFALLAQLFSLTAMAYDAEIDGIYYDFWGTQAIVAKCYKSGSVIIPQSVTYNEKNYEVVAIRNYAFYDCSGLTSITLSKGLTTIGERAFWGCSRLTSITIPETVTNISNGAFDYCSALTSIEVEEGNTVYDSRNGCNAIIETASNTLIEGCMNTIIPEGVITVRGFAGCTGLISITIPNSVTIILEAFNDCYGLTTITIPNSVTSVSGFKNCRSLTAITIPESVSYIHPGTFEGCSALASIVVDEGNTIYDSRNGCNAIIETASNTLIKGCENTVIPEDVTSISRWAFSGCSGQGSLIIPQSVTNFDAYAFSGCNMLTSVNIPNTMTSIGDRTFAGCGRLASVNIPNSITSIDYGAFMGCEALTTITIPASVTSIGSDAFRQCYNLISVTLPDSITYIGYQAFLMCQKLNSIKIPNGVTKIEDGLFDGCMSLTSVTIPKTVTSIGRYAFSCCPLSTIIMGADIPMAVTPDVFSGMDYSNVSLYVPRGSKVLYKAADVWKDFGEIIEYNCVDVKDQMIAVGGSTMMEIEVSNSDTDIVAFQMDLTLPEGVSLDKTGCSLSSRITDEEQELTIGKLENGAYRLTSSSLSLTPISGNNGTLITLKLTTTEDSDDGQATISNIRFSTADSKRIEMDDVSFNIDIVREFKLTYTVDDEVYKTYTVEYGTALTAEEEPTKEGYTFSGWSELPETMPAHDVVVTGSFSVNSYTLTYIVDGEVYKTDTVEYGTTLSAEEPTKEGFTFGGWSEIPETMPAQDVVVTGSFTINSYNLTYIVDGEVFKTSSVVYGTELTPEAEPTKDGYTFGGWSELAETMPAYDVVVTGGFYLYGDVNTDDEVDVVDVVDIARFVVATPSVKFREKLADLNFDNLLNIGDAVTLVNYIAGDQNFVKEMLAPEQNVVADALSLTKDGKTVALNLTNGRAYTAFQFDLYVPEGANIAKMMLNSQRKQKHQLLYNKVEDGHYRVAALSISNNTFQGTEGELLSFVLEEEINVEVEISDVHFFDTRGNDYTLDVIGIDQETGVMSMQETETSGAIYDLQGRKLSKMQRGVNIVDGKKVIMK